MADQYWMSENGQLRPCTPEETANLNLLHGDDPDQPTE
jgi:hypothetical protein